MNATAYTNPDAERIVLAAMFKPKSAKAVSDMLRASDFADAFRGQVFTAMQALLADGKRVELPSLADKLVTLYGNDSLMDVALDARSQYGLSAEFVAEQNAQLVREKAQAREMKSALNEAIAQLDNGEETAERVSEALRNQLRVEGGASDVVECAEVLSDAFETLEKRAKGISKGMTTGIAGIDRCMAGLHHGEMTVLGARPAVGKSALAGEIAINAARNGAKVLICSREMTSDQYGIRMLMRGTNIGSEKLRSGQLEEKDWAQLSDSMMLFEGSDIKFTFKVKTVEQLRRVVDHLKERNGLDLLVVDYTQLMQTTEKYKDDWQRIGHVTKALKDMTVDFNIAVLALSQVGRNTEGNMPSLNDLRGSGDIEQDADNVLFLHRPKSADDEYVRSEDKELFAGLEAVGEQYLVLNIAKQRQGEIRAIALCFNPGRMQFSGILREK